MTFHNHITVNKRAKKLVKFKKLFIVCKALCSSSNKMVFTAALFRDKKEKKGVVSIFALKTKKHCDVTFDGGAFVKFTMSQMPTHLKLT